MLLKIFIVALLAPFFVVAEPTESLAPQRRTRPCDILPTIPNGRVNPGITGIGATRTIGCDPTYVITGPGLIYCSAMGWTRPGVCKAASTRITVIPGPFNWYEAVINCTTNTTRIAMPKTNLDHALITWTLLEKNIKTAWIGLTRLQVDSKHWHWVDGQTLNGHHDFQAWMPGEPTRIGEYNANLQLCVKYDAIEKPYNMEDDPDIHGWNNYPCSLNHWRMDDKQRVPIAAVCQSIPHVDDQGHEVEDSSHFMRSSFPTGAADALRRNY